MSMYIHKGREDYISEAGPPRTKKTKVAPEKQHTISEPNAHEHTDTQKYIQNPSISTLPITAPEAQVGPPHTSHIQTLAPDILRYPGTSHTQVATHPPNPPTQIAPPILGIHAERAIPLPESATERVITDLSATEIAETALWSQYTTSEPPHTLHIQTHAADELGYLNPLNTQVAIPTVAMLPPNSATNVYMDLSPNNLVFPALSPSQPDTPEHPDTSHTQFVPPASPRLETPRPAPANTLSILSTNRSTDWDTPISATIAGTPSTGIDLDTHGFVFPSSLSYIMPEFTTDDHNPESVLFVSSYLTNGTTLDTDTQTDTPTNAGPSYLTQDTTTETSDNETIRLMSSHLTEGTTIDTPASAQTQTQTQAHEKPIVDTRAASKP